MTQPYAPSPYRPMPAPVLTQEDEKQLDLLSGLFYAYAGLFAIVGLMMSAFAILPALFIPVAGGGASGWLVSGIFFVIFAGVTVLVWAKAVVIVLAARAFGRRTNHMLCTVGACMTLMNLPLGTALGVFALAVLQRPQVKARFSS